MYGAGGPPPMHDPYALSAGMGVPGAPGYGPPPAEPRESLWVMIDDRMRGRWRWAILVGVILSAALAAAGFMSAKPLFQSTGAIRISPEANVLLERIDEHSVPYYDRFVATQLALMKSPRLLEFALTYPDLAKLDIAKRRGAVNELRDGLVTESNRDIELVYIGFEHENPVVAHAACNAIIWAYMEQHGKHGGVQIDNTITELEAIRKERNRDLESLQLERGNIMRRHGTNDLNVIASQNSQYLAQLEWQMFELKRKIDHAANRQSAEAGAPVEVDATPGQLESISPKLALLRQQRDEAAIIFEQLKAKLRPTHRLYLDAQGKLENLRRLHDEEHQKALETWRTARPAHLLAQGTGFEGLTLEELKRELESRQNQAAELRRRQDELLPDLQYLDELKLREEQYNANVRAVQHRMENMETESKSISSRIGIEVDGALPDEPSRDPRPKRALMGAALGMIGTLGAFFLLGTLDRRAYGASQLHHMSVAGLPPCLGVLPDLSNGLTNAETSDVASHCVHQIRNQIEALREPHNGYVLAVTSPFQGDGKTSIAMALGWSYAAAGFKTLIIDCDMVGRSLTRQLGLVGREGLKEALAARELNGSITSLPIEHLNAVPVGVDPKFGPANVRRIDLDRLLEQVRDQYDIILVDTGPMLGSLESTPVVVSADGVVLSVRRGRSRSRLEDCMNRLRMLGTPCVGVILNCAVRRDCNRYVSEASLAAAEEDRAHRPQTEGVTVLARTMPGERNALIQAMQTSGRTHPAPTVDPGE